MGVMGGTLLPVFDRLVYRRWVFLILGGALSFPYVLFAFVVIPAVVPSVAGPALVAGIGVVLAVMLATTFIPAVRVLEGTAVRELLDDPVPDTTFGATASWRVRLRFSAMFLLHVLIGAVLSFCTLLLPVMLVSGVAAPFTGQIGLIGNTPLQVPTGLASAWIPFVPVLGAVVLVHAVRLAGWALRRAAVTLLGVPPWERIEQLERQAEHLIERNRLAQELHDSIGHALSVVTMQAGAARFALSAGTQHVEEALGAIESAGRAALDDLDYVLGRLRDEPAREKPPSSLTQLPHLIEATRLAGVTVDAHIDGDLARLPATVSRQAYRIVQECLTNVLRHAGQVLMELRVEVTDGRIDLLARNPVRATGARRTGGGRGLRGIAERVDLLGGQFSAGRQGDRWEVAVSLAWDGGA
ncbi:sensor histidine kinase [Actinophytocola xinjiangensis]|uniref:histidine kinase n=2 Tax=Actinophytocola xinjiangensis TaxID=485602 RepID=A0A7Z1AWP6_9PSEU|nr:sensor histidine kinase [Actinophytocola xinjiangensis]